MEFDESKVYTALNADKLKIGSEVIVADSLMRLKSFVDGDCEAKKLVDIRNESTLYRFHVRENDDSTYESVYALAYLVSEPEENKLKWTDLKIGDIITDGQMECMVVTIDKGKTAILRICVITANGNDWLDDTDLECWKKVEVTE